MSSLAAGAGWQLLIAVVEALMEARLWKLKALCQSWRGWRGKGHT